MEKSDDAAMFTVSLMLQGPPVGYLLIYTNVVCTDGSPYCKKVRIDVSVLHVSISDYDLQL